MKLKELYSLIIKIFGFFVIKDIFATFPYLITSGLYMFNDRGAGYGYLPLLFSLLIMGLYAWLAYVLIFRTSAIGSFLKLEPEIAEEPLSFHVSTKNVLTVAIILLAGYVLVEEIPDLCKALFHYYEISRLEDYAADPEISTIVVPVIKIIIALLLIGERKKIIEFISKDQQPGTEGQ